MRNLVVKREDMNLAYKFEKGKAYRSSILPVGCVGVGCVHSHNNLFVLVEGTMISKKPDGTIQVIHAPYMEVQQAGSSRIGYAITDCVGVNVFNVSDDIDTPEKLEAYITTGELCKLGDKLCLLGE